MSAIFFSPLTLQSTYAKRNHTEDLHKPPSVTLHRSEPKKKVIKKNSVQNRTETRSKWGRGVIRKMVKETNKQNWYHSVLYKMD